MRTQETTPAGGSPGEATVHWSRILAYDPLFFSVRKCSSGTASLAVSLRRSYKHIPSLGLPQLTALHVPPQAPLMKMTSLQNLAPSTSSGRVLLIQESTGCSGLLRGSVTVLVNCDMSQFPHDTYHSLPSSKSPEASKSHFALQGENVTPHFQLTLST